MADVAIDLLEDIRPEIRSELGEPDSNFFTNEELDRWVNYAIKDFCRRTKILKTTTTYTWSANTDSVSLSTILGTTTMHHLITSARWNNGSYGTVPTLVSKLHVFENEPSRDVSSTKGLPEELYYSESEKKIGLKPTPDTEGTLTLDYSYELVKLSESNTSLDTALSKWWQDICAWAIYRGKLKDVDHFTESQAQEALARYEKGIILARQDIQRREHPNRVISFIKDYSPPY